MKTRNTLQRRYVTSIGLAIVTIGALALSGCAAGGSASPSASSNSSDKSPIKLGATGTMTGANAASCAELVPGAQAWIDKVNAGGGIDGHKIDWTVLDDGGDPTRGVANAKRLINDGVQAMFYNCASPGAIASLPIVKAANLADFFPNSVSDGILRPAQDNLFTLLPLFDQQIATVIPYAMKKNGPGTAAVVYLDGYSKNIVPATEWAVKKAGGKLVSEIAAPASTTDWGPTVIKLKAANPDYVFLVQSSPNSGGLVKEMARQGYAPPKGIAGAYQLADAIYTTNAGAAGVGTLMVTNVVPPEDKRAAECNAALPKGVKPAFFTVFGCAGAQAMVAILKSAITMKGGITTENLAAAAKEQAFSDVPVSAPLKYSGSSMLTNEMYVYKVGNNGVLELDQPKPIPLAKDSNWIVK